MKKKDLWLYLLSAVVAVMLASCQVSDQELGTDLLPPGDNVLLFHDTIFDIQTHLVSGRRLVTSESRFDPQQGRIYLLGSLRDTIRGISTAEIMTQFNTTTAYRAGPNTVIDSLVLYLRVRDFIEDTDGPFTIRVYELTDRIYMDSVYYSDYGSEGRYDPVPLAEKSIVPESNSTIEFLINDQEFLGKFLAIQDDTTYFRNDSIFKDYFNGFYITAEPSGGNGTMAEVMLSDSRSRLSMKYANDSTDIDTIEGMDFRWVNFSINEFSSEKINLYNNDYGGTYLSSFIGQDSLTPPYLYVQGIAGVNTAFSFSSLQSWVDSGDIVISNANLIFEVVPEEESGLSYEKLPERLMVYTLLEDGNYERLYDFVADNSPNQILFGGRLKAESRGMFYDTTYSYRFNIGLHLQAMLRQEKLENQFILNIYDTRYNPRIVKLRSNHPDSNGRLRLEIVYLKL
jgi:hypothetical protein